VLHLDNLPSPGTSTAPPLRVSPYAMNENL
jgi:hypothetical protein